MTGELVYRVQGTSAQPMKVSTLEAAGLREREHLQEWVLANPEILGDDVLVVTSEFDQWFSKDGRDPDRLDILGLGADGRLVVAELKRDLTPDIVRAVREGETMRAEIALHAMPLGMVHLVAGNMGQVVGVRRVETMEGRIVRLAA